MRVTDTEQSKKLLDLGLDPKSADLYYINGQNLSHHSWKDDEHDEDDIPAWSLSALFEILPIKIVHSIVGMNKYLEMDIDTLGEERVFSLSLGKDVSKGFYCGYDVTYCYDYDYDGKAYAIITYDKNNPIVPIYNAIVWLLENHRMDGDGKLLY